jgi:hypothetical protein
LEEALDLSSDRILNDDDQHYNAVKMVYNILKQSSLLGPFPKSIDFLDTKHYVSESDSASFFRQDTPNC